MPLINIVWDKSFADREGNLKAIRERGWNPLNYYLLTDPEIIATKPAVENVGDEFSQETLTIAAGTRNDLVEYNGDLSIENVKRNDSECSVLFCLILS